MAQPEKHIRINVQGPAPSWDTTMRGLRRTLNRFSAVAALRGALGLERTALELQRGPQSFDVATQYIQAMRKTLKGLDRIVRALPQRPGLTQRIYLSRN